MGETTLWGEDDAELLSKEMEKELSGDIKHEKRNWSLWAALMNSEQDKGDF